jgi:hypothetical protein
MNDYVDFAGWSEIDGARGADRSAEGTTRMGGNVTPGFPLRAERQSFRWLQAWGLIGLAVVGSLASAAEVAPRQPQQKRSVAPSTVPAGPTTNRADTRTPARSPKVDHAVMPAGGGSEGHSACGQCQRSACPQCRIAEGKHHGHRPCPHGLCPAHCPVRPDVFGFYGTRWRRWPGSGVVQVSNDDAVTPARPPKTEVPGPREESIEPDAAAEDLPAPAAASAAEDRVDAVASNTAWRSFTAAEQRKESVQP